MRPEARLVFGLVCSASLLAPGCPKKEAEPLPGPQPVERAADYIDPFIATNGFGFRIASGFPGPAAPNGLVKVSPDTSGPYGVVRFTIHRPASSGRTTPRTHTERIHTQRNRVPSTQSTVIR